ncbi:MAG: hemerythrin family protein [Victivallales bacterium]
MTVNPQEYMTGIPAIDNQHAHYVELLNEFVIGSQTGNVGRNEFNAGVNKVIAYALEHFDSEEFLMRSIDYPLYEEHLLKHNIFREKMDGLLAEMDAVEINIDDYMNELSKWLVEWFKIQIMDDDVKLAGYIRENNIAC